MTQRDVPSVRYTKRRVAVRIEAALKRASGEVSGNANKGGMYARGLSSEGYAGGYAQALRDVLLVLNNVRPNTRDYWEGWK